MENPAEETYCHWNQPTSAPPTSIVNSKTTHGAPFFISRCRGSQTPTYRSYGLATVRYPVLEVTATVEPFENRRGFSLRVLRAGKPRLCRR